MTAVTSVAAIQLILRKFYYLQLNLYQISDNMA